MERKFISEKQPDHVLQEKRNQKKSRERSKNETEARAFKDQLIAGQKLRVLRFSFFWDLSLRKNRNVDHITVHLNQKVPPFLLQECIRKAIEGM